jgi:hypothetical protein
MPKVWNKRDPLTPKDAVYVGRPSKWGNIYSHLPSKCDDVIQVESREKAVELYREWLSHLTPTSKQLLINELKGKDLVCWCAPKACHADVLLEIANAE